MSCVPWEGAKNKAGYPITWHENEWAYAHRVVAHAKKGEVVLHTCDNPSCVNPDHLVKGTHKDNSQDMVKKNRQAKGEQCGNTKLTAKQVLEIRQSSLSSRKLAQLYNVSKTNVLDIKRKKIWGHI